MSNLELIHLAYQPHFRDFLSMHTDKRQLFKLVSFCWLEVIIGATIKLASKFRGAVNRINVIAESHKSECSPDSHNSERRMW